MRRPGATPAQRPQRSGRLLHGPTARHMDCPYMWQLVAFNQCGHG